MKYVLALALMISIAATVLMQQQAPHLQEPYPHHFGLSEILALEFVTEPQHVVTLFEPRDDPVFEQRLQKTRAHSKVDFLFILGYGLLLVCIVNLLLKPISNTLYTVFLIFVAIICISDVTENLSILGMLGQLRSDGALTKELYLLEKATNMKWMMLFITSGLTLAITLRKQIKILRVWMVLVGLTLFLFLFFPFGSLFGLLNWAELVILVYIMVVLYLLGLSFVQMA